MAEAAEARLQTELDAIKAQIDAAYWRFIRCARGKPPVLALGPEIFRRHTYLWQLQRAVRAGRACLIER